MQRYKALILTDHAHHTSENSLYELAVKLYLHPAIASLDIATRSIPLNSDFFNHVVGAPLYTTSVSEDFKYRHNNSYLEQNCRKAVVEEYDFVWLRMPPPLSSDFLDFLSKRCKDQIIINNPKTILETGSKEFLMNFPDLCPPMKICHSIEDIIDFKKRFPIVLKPFRAYGGKGIVKIDGNKVFKGKTELLFDQFIDELGPENLPYLAVKYLENVNQGDKRIIVIDGNIMGASLRLPSHDSWICNVSMGGSSHVTEVSEEELHIIATVDPILSQKGIIMYGVDTLVDDNHKRVLSEINTTSIGGLPQIARLKREPLVEKGIDLIIQYIDRHR